ncbi:RdgB/HAM1 family non-canonical purine NTP pyrophosphatase [Synechococcus sp. J7-Johnson]|uniref:RdgB/HAM1 family non-canonical purine NTP pyrophosphatase n=1 Tax=Synechococcus sp. J7-Johnson TaxID=2823737 RepID=UPI0020CC33BE|nr:RdgB/HAM1 family non-canonical purine NTP pyrophosphatase [Synechococcus sp. J7-Johnson]
MLVIASGNRHKIREMEAMLAPLELDVAPQPEGLEVEETGSTFAENARLKAETVARLTGRWALADDSGLAVDVLGGAPGVYSARYAQGDEQRMARLLGEMGDTPYRSAALITALAVADPSGSTILEAEGICRGEILRQPVAAAGYGYNRLLHVREAGCTLAEMPPHQLEKLGSRAKALHALAVDLPRVLGLNGA